MTLLINLERRRAKSITRVRKREREKNNNNGKLIAFLQKEEHVLQLKDPSLVRWRPDCCLSVATGQVTFWTRHQSITERPTSNLLLVSLMRVSLQ